jgi:competence protein ComEC
MLLFMSIQMTAYHERRPPHSSTGVLHQYAGQMQQQLAASFGCLQLTEAERSVLRTVTLGERSTIPREVRRQFSVAGVAHILSVSGFHVAIVCGFLLRLLSFLSGSSAGRWVRYLLTLLLLWTFVMVSGLAAPSVRAAIMLSLYLTGEQISRTTDGCNTLAVAAFGMLVYEPFYLFDMGFQLSYVAVAFILWLQPRLSGLIWVRNPLLKTPWEWLTLTLAAQTGVTFLCLYHFGQFSSVFLFTNLPIMLIATLLIPLALLWLLLPDVIPGLDWVVEMLTRSMVWIVDAFSRAPGSSLSFRFDFPTMLMSYGGLILLLLYFEQRNPRLLLTSLFLLLCIIVWAGIID